MSYESRFNSIKSVIDKKSGERDYLKKQKSKLKDTIAELKAQSNYLLEARTVIQQVAKLTQQEIEYHISDLVSIALSSVFDDPYEFKIEFVEIRNKTEAELWFVRNNEKFHPLTSSGGGAVDIAAFALRIALWKISQNKTRPVLILDEPFKHLSSDLQSSAGAMLNQLSHKLGLQVIVISHTPDIVEYADKIFTVSNKNGVSIVN